MTFNSDILYCYIIDIRVLLDFFYIAFKVVYLFENLINFNSKRCLYVV